jgi:hypothetical protein
MNTESRIPQAERDHFAALGKLSAEARRRRWAMTPEQREEEQKDMLKAAEVARRKLREVMKKIKSNARRMRRTMRKVHNQSGV